MNEILTAKEWLEKENAINKDGKLNWTFDLERVVRDYANYRNRMLEAKILEFRNQIIVEDWMKMPYRYNEEFLEQFDKYFNITTERQGKIN